MKVTVKRDDLVRELSVVAQATSRKATIPILSHVMLTADAGRLMLSATDFEVWMIGECPCAGTDGAATVSAEKLLELSKSLPSGADVDLEVRAKGGVVMKSGQFVANLSALPVQEFPVRPSMEGLSQRMLPRSAFRDMLLRTRYSVREDRIHFMNGVLMRLEPGQFECVSTDGYRMAYARSPLSGDEQAGEAILPRRTVDALVQMFESGDEHLRYCVSDNHLFFSLGSRLLVSRIIDGKFPAWKRVVPFDVREGSLTVRMGRSSLLSTIRRAAMVTDDKASSVSVEMKSTGVTVRASSSQFGDAVEDLLVSGASGATDKSVLWHINATFVDDLLSAIVTDEVEIEAMAERSDLPIVVRESGDGGFFSIGVLMPMRK